MTTPRIALRGSIAGQALSARETEVLKAYARLGDQQMAADALGMTKGTVKNHLSRAYEKLEVPSAIAALTALGWIHLP